MPLPHAASRCASITTAGRQPTCPGFVELPRITALAMPPSAGNQGDEERKNRRQHQPGFAWQLPLAAAPVGGRGHGLEEEAARIRQERPRERLEANSSLFLLCVYIFKRLFDECVVFWDPDIKLQPRMSQAAALELDYLLAIMGPLALAEQFRHRRVFSIYPLHFKI
jgi:hypothetical protein